MAGVVASAQVLAQNPPDTPLIYFLPSKVVASPSAEGPLIWDNQCFPGRHGCEALLGRLTQAWGMGDRLQDMGFKKRGAGDRVQEMGYWKWAS